jgi:FKBP-type peptidyl-prolyl cis-trans isomerase (trigger factor)
VGDKRISVFEFKQAVEAAGEEAFPGERGIEPETRSRLQAQVLNQLIEELIIVAHAEDTGVHLSEAEVDQAISKIKADYPDNTFDETLLENAISYDIWKERIARHLLVEKVVDRELIDQVQLSTEDIADYYQTMRQDKKDAVPNTDEQNKKMVLQLRRLKAEEAYQQWVDDLRKKYPVEINRREWENLVNEESN